MATGVISYTLKVTPTYTEIYDRGTVTASISAINGSLPSGGYITGGEINFTEIKKYTSQSMYWRVTSPSDAGTIYAETVGNSAQSSDQGQFMKFVFNFEKCPNISGILNYSTGQEIGLHFYLERYNNLRVFNLRSSVVTIVINYTYTPAPPPTPSDTYVKSTGALSKQSVTLNGSDSIGLTITNSGSTATVYHKIVWAIGSSSYTQTKDGTGSVSTTFSLDYCNQVTNATSASNGTVTLYTYSDSDKTNLVGSSAYYFTTVVPDSVVPIISSCSISLFSTPISGLCINGKSKVSISISASGARGSSISKYRITGPSYDKTINTSNTSITEGNITAQGNNSNATFTVAVTDSRGRTATSSASIYVYGYGAPGISSCSGKRTDSSGQLDANGTSLTVTAELMYSNLNGRNTATWSWKYRRITNPESSWINSGKSGLSSGTSSKLDNVLALNTSYEIQITVIDTLGSSITITATVPDTDVYLYYKKGGTALGIGKRAVNDFAVEVSENWAMIWGYLNNDHSKPIRIPGVIYTDSNTTLNDNQGRLGMIWLKAT